MTTQLTKDLVETKRLGRKLDLPSTIENIINELDFGEKVCLQELRDRIFILEIVVLLIVGQFMIG